MLFKKILFLLCLFYFINLNAQVVRYLVYRENFPQDRFYLLDENNNPVWYYFHDLGYTSVNEVKNPFQITKYEINYNGKYAIWTLECADGIDFEATYKLYQLNYLYILDSTFERKYFDAQRGGYLTNYITDKHNELPSDFYEPIDINISTTT